MAAEKVCWGWQPLTEAKPAKHHRLASSVCSVALTWSEAACTPPSGDIPELHFVLTVIET